MARRSAAGEGLDRRGLGGRHLSLQLVEGGGRLQLLQLQLVLVQQALAALGGLAEVRPLELGDLQLEVGDQGGVGRCLGFHHAGARLGGVGPKLGRSEGGAERCDLLQTGLKLFRHEGSRARIGALEAPRRAPESLRRSYPAACGRQLCWGFLQSIPSSR